jgi:hypothetical protein
MPRYKLRTLLTTACLFFAAISIIAFGAAIETTGVVVVGVAVLMAAGVSLKRLRVS